MLGVDPGERRLGFAVSDPDRVVAPPHSTVELPAGCALARIAAEIAAVASAADVTTVVIGLPRTPSGRDGRAAQRSRALAVAVEQRTGLVVQLWDERHTTAEAHRRMLEQGASRGSRRAALDRLAATLILQSYLDAERARST